MPSAGSTVEDIEITQISVEHHAAIPEAADEKAEGLLNYGEFGLNIYKLNTKKPNDYLLLNLAILFYT